MKHTPANTSEIKRFGAKQNLSKTAIVKHNDYQAVKGKDSTKCELPQFNRHTTGSSPGVLKQEYLYNKYNSSSSMENKNTHIYARPPNI